MLGDIAGAFGGWSQVIIAGGVVLTGLAVAYRWMKNHVADPLKEIPVIRAAQVEIRNELHPNGGSSMRDSIDRNEQVTVETSVQVVELTDKVSGHIADDNARWETIDVSLAALKVGQKEAAVVAVATADELAHTVLDTAQALHDEQAP
jgi:hypothetical protein